VRELCSERRRRKTKKKERDREYVVFSRSECVECYEYLEAVLLITDKSDATVERKKKKEKKERERERECVCFRFFICLSVMRRMGFWRLLY
jgi:hypothetical protein